MLSGHAFGLHETSESDDLHLEDVVSANDEEAEHSGRVLYTASFDELTKGHVHYETVIWILISLLLILAWGVGVLMLLYLPMRRYVLQKDISSRRLYVTSDKIVYKATRPSYLPFLGFTKIDRHIPLHMVIDIIIEQGTEHENTWLVLVLLALCLSVCSAAPWLKSYRALSRTIFNDRSIIKLSGCLQSAYGICTFRIESIGQGKAAQVDQLQFQGVSNPELLRKVIIMEAAKRIQVVGSWKPALNSREGVLRTSSWRSSSETPTLSRLQSPRRVKSLPRRALLEAGGSIPGDSLLKKIEEVNQHVKKLENFVAESQSNALQG